ncbi:hypothetical protein SASPL_140223 [Salvia splendens]|uniref:Sieve element occlusion C-terminal domain-containing protein n=1 Tax=Salvia splendens TaxID=180675 RepID=A0A8X8WRL4_SALSN|nr:hypothetical protein SASPL_140223 [Salvia splendens]
MHHASSPTRNVDDFLIREIVLTHDPDDQQQLDPDLLLTLVEAIFSCMTENPIDFDQDTFFDYDLSASEEPVCRTISVEAYWCSDRAVVAAWGLYSLGNKLSCLCNDLGECIDTCQQQIERRLYEKLLHVFKEKGDNQKALHAFFSWQDEFPFKDYSSKKIGILELKSKIVLLLITKPDLLPLDKAYFLVQQTTGAEDCVVLWTPVLSTNGPWSLHPAVVSFFKQEWGLGDDPVLVVLNEDGLVSNTNAMDMVWIWGPRAFPFTSEREKVLWEQANRTVGLLVDGISPLLSQWIEQGRNLCIYGSDNIDWIRNFSKKIKKIQALGFDLEAVYVRCKNPGENVRSIIHTIDQEDLSSSITLSSVDFFWFRLETLKRSIGQQGRAGRCDEIAARVGELLDSGSKDGWGVIGKGWSKDVVMLEQGVLEQGLEALQMWRGNETVTGLAGALEGPGDGRGCKHDEVVEYEEGLAEKTKICGSCRVPMEKFVVYKCEA